MVFASINIREPSDSFLVYAYCLAVAIRRHSCHCLNLLKSEKLKHFLVTFNDKKVLFTKQTLSIFYNMNIHVKLIKTTSGRFVSLLTELFTSAIALRPKFFLSISKILKKVLGLRLYFVMIALNVDGIRVH